MAISLLLALRLPQLEVWCGGLDRMLRLHRQTAVGGALVLTAHWLLVEAPKWAVSAGWLSRPARRGASAAEVGAGAGNGISLHALGNTLGEWSFYLLIALVVLSLLALVSYGRFRLIHRLAPLIYLAGWCHGLCLLPQIGAMTPVGGIDLVCRWTGSYMGPLLPAGTSGSAGAPSRPGHCGAGAGGSHLRADYATGAAARPLPPGSVCLLRI